VDEPRLKTDERPGFFTAGQAKNSNAAGESNNASSPLTPMPVHELSDSGAINQCVMQTGLDYDGHDLQPVQAIPARNAAACCALCGQNKQCK
jgi:hypothetical protein